jgi:hypothetical protein
MRAIPTCCGKKVVNATDGLTVDLSVIFSLKSGASERKMVLVPSARCPCHRKEKRLGDEDAKPKQIR